MPGAKGECRRQDDSAKREDVLETTNLCSCRDPAKAEELLLEQQQLVLNTTGEKISKLTNPSPEVQTRNRTETSDIEPL